MSLTDAKRRQTMQNVLPEIRKMLPGHSAQEQQALVEQMDRTASGAAQGSEEAYIKKMAAKLGGIQRKLAKQAQSQAGASPTSQAALNPPEALAFATGPGQAGASGSQVQQARPVASQLSPALPHDLHQATSGVRPGSNSAQQAQQQWRGQPPPARYMPWQGATESRQSIAGQLAPQHQQLQHQQHYQQHRQFQQQQQQQPQAGPGYRQPFQGGLQAQAHASSRPRAPLSGLQVAARPPYMGPVTTPQQQPPQLLGQQMRPQPQATDMTEFDQLLPASPSMQQMVYGLILHKDQRGPAQTLPNPEAQHTHARHTAGSAQQAQGRPLQQQQWTRQVQTSQPGSFMELLTADNGADGFPGTWQLQGQKPAGLGLAPAAAAPSKPGIRAPSLNAAQQSASQGSHSLGSSAGTPTSRPSSGMDGDFTEQYWGLMTKIQQDIVPVLERLKGMFGASSKLGAESEKVANKLSEILSLLPRLKIQQSDPKYVGRMWTKREFEHLEKIAKQLGPYCKRFAPEAQSSAVRPSGLAAAPGQQVVARLNQQGPGPGVGPSPMTGAAPAVQSDRLQPGVHPPTRPAEPSDQPIALQQTVARPQSRGLSAGTAQSQSILEDQASLLSRHCQGGAQREASATSVLLMQTESREDEQQLGRAVTAPYEFSSKQFFEAAAAFKNVSEDSGTRELQGVLLEGLDGMPVPPSNLIYSSSLPSQQVLKRAFTATHEGFHLDIESAAHDRGTASYQQSHTKKVRKASPAMLAALHQRRSLLEAECHQAGTQLGSSIQLSVSEAPDEPGCLLVHAFPALAPAVKADQDGSKAANCVDQHDWRVLTVKFPPSYPNSPPIVLVDCGWQEPAEMSKATVARDYLEHALASTMTPLKVDQAVIAWKDALASAEETA